MTSKQQGPGKDDPRNEDGPGSKRPHATLDLKAVEIKGTKSDDGKPSTAAATTAGAPGTTTTGKAEEAKASTSTPPTPAQSATDSSAARSAAGSAATPASSSAKPAGPPPRSSGSGFGSFLTHTAAGILGGFLALLGADTLGPIGRELGLPTGGMQWSDAANKMQQRLAALEQSLRTTAADADLVDKLAATEGRLAKLDQLEKDMSALRDENAKLAASAKAMEEQLAQQPAAGAPAVADGRIDELEQQLKALAASAERDPQPGRIPQLAAITGKVADLESTLGTQLAALRNSVTEELDKRLAATAEASESAKSGTQRIDRQLAEVRTENTRTTQRLEALKADGDRTGQTLRVLQEEAGSLRSGLDALKGDVDARLAATAKPADVAKAVAPVAEKISSLEQNLAGIVKAEADRKTNAERILLSLELANLKRVIDRGQSYARELAEVKKTAGTAIDLSPLARYQDEGVPTLPELASSFRPIAHKMLDAADEPAEGSVIDRLLSGAKSVVRVRKVSHSADDSSPEAIVARMDAALKEARLGDVITLSKGLDAKALAPAEDWLSKVAARHAVDSALGAIEGQLKSSLAGSGTPSVTRTN